MVTLVVPIYNMEAYLPRCVASIQAQTCRDFEVVLVDDGSTDSSGALCDAYAAGEPERFRVVHKPNGGLSSARNAGIDAARGEFVSFPDPDDWLEPDYVELLLRTQREHGADLVCLGHYVDTDEGSFPVTEQRELRLLEPPHCQRSLLMGPRFQGFSWNKLYRLDLIREHGLRFPDRMGTTEDLYFGYQYLAHCRLVCHDPEKRIYHYYQREDSSTRSGFTPDKLETMRAYEHILADCAGRDPELAQVVRDEMCTCAVNLLWMHENADDRDPAIRNRLRALIRDSLPGYFHTKNFGIGRKVQAVLAALSPKLFMHLKNLVQRR